MNILPKYFQKKTSLTLKSALEECVLADSERSKSFIYKKFYGYLMAVALRYVKDEMEAEDVVNESFVKIFRKVRDFSFDSDDQVIEKTFKAWMARVTVNTSIDKIRAKKETYALDDVHDGELAQHAVNSSTRLEENDILNLLYGLPEIQRSIFNLYEIEGYSHEEIGKLLNIPESTSRTYLTRAKARLRKLYTDQFSVLDNINHS
ncbi:RNA polymerase sigma-70 factor, ECF subfamily [Sphingobacterium nematocida]|uniref:RNA polymerase sigma-70 factor, ECF subfamily n=1 Tax=Sphingobacterium nematocida TaxID=1513896 RepID=A0A1T5FNQ5_9SPHI|nr:RNA polymerase sigma-70 factor, ECF subfamily [Sphingobacterium nematocida]